VAPPAARQPGLHLQPQEGASGRAPLPLRDPLDRADNGAVEMRGRVDELQVLQISPLGLREQCSEVGAPASTTQRRAERDRGTVGFQRTPLDDQTTVQRIVRGGRGGSATVAGAPALRVRDDADMSQGPTPHLVGRDGDKPLLLEAAEESRAFYFHPALCPLLGRTGLTEPSEGHSVVVAEWSGVGMVRSTERLLVRVAEEARTDDAPGFRAENALDGGAVEGIGCPVVNHSSYPANQIERHRDDVTAAVSKPPGVPIRASIGPNRYPRSTEVLDTAA